MDKNTKEVWKAYTKDIIGFIALVIAAYYGQYTMPYLWLWGLILSCLGLLMFMYMLTDIMWLGW